MKRASRGPVIDSLKERTHGMGIFWGALGAAAAVEAKGTVEAKEGRGRGRSGEHGVEPRRRSEAAMAAEAVEGVGEVREGDMMEGMEGGREIFL